VRPGTSQTRHRPATKSSARPDVSQRVLLFGLCAAYCILLNFSYWKVESVTFSSLGLIYNPPCAIFILLGFALALFPAYWMPITVERPSQVVLWWLYVSVIIPSMFIPFHVLETPASVTAQLSFALAICFALACACSSRPLTIRLPSSGLKPAVTCMWLSSFVILMCVAISQKDGFHITFSLSDVYDRRLEVRDAIEGGSLKSYALAILRWSVAPILIAEGIVRRKPFWFVAGAMGAIFSFSFSGEKLTLFLPLYLFLLSILVIRCRKLFGVCFLTGILSLLSLGMIEYIYVGSNHISTHITRRQLITPSQLTAYYFDFFGEHGFTWFAESLLRGILPPPYELGAGQLIGSVYLGNADNNCVANIWAVGYSECGVLGMLLSSLLLGVLLRLLDAFSSLGDFYRTSLVAGLMALSWGSSSLFTAMLSGGVAINFLLLWLLQEAPSGSTARSWRPIRGGFQRKAWQK